MDQFIRATRIPQGACQHARHGAYAMCYAASERLARQSLLAAFRLVVASLRALINLMLLLCLLILIVWIRCTST